MYTQKKIKKISLLLVLVIFMTTFSQFAFAKVKYVKIKGALGDMMKLSDDRNKMIKEYNRETKAYNKIKKAIEENVLEFSVDSADINKKYGAPTIILDKEPDGLIKWVYKPGLEPFTDSDKAYLIFDKSNKLIDWSIVYK